MSNARFFGNRCDVAGRFDDILPSKNSAHVRLGVCARDEFVKLDNQGRVLVEVA
jgi:hypothetical protein